MTPQKEMSPKVQVRIVGAHLSLVALCSDEEPDQVRPRVVNCGLTRRKGFAALAREARSARRFAFAFWATRCRFAASATRWASRRRAVNRFLSLYSAIVPPAPPAPLRARAINLADFRGF